jgi:hypothetical protein
MEIEQPDFAPPKSLSTPLIVSLWRNFKDVIAPRELPPLELSSRPVDVGMILGDRLALPWYRTVFTNLGDVVTPETQAPLELQSPPVDTGELLGDQLQRGWWSSLLRNVADAVAPERLPALALTSSPTQPPNSSAYLFAPRWSELLTTPKIFYADRPREAERYYGFVMAPLATPHPSSALSLPTRRNIEELTGRKRKELRFAYIREGLWVSCVIAEVLFLFAYILRG